MKFVKRTVMTVIIVVACAGVYGALSNLPIVSGCAFYGECAAHTPGTATVAQEESLAAAPLGAAADSVVQ